MKSFLIFVVFVIIGMGQVYAHENNIDNEEKVQHYQVEKPKTKEEALSVLTSKSKEIEKILLNKNLSSSDLEEIHEMSYSLEASVDYLRENENNKKQEAALDNLDESVQALHYGSENHNEAETREWFVKLKAAIAGL
ncbi:MAG: hypothetical protein RCG15_00520 [Candidatus Rickettsia vulgarisii]